MARLSIAYADQNESFARFLPRSGTVIKTIQDTRQDSWMLVQLDEPFEYQVKVGERFRFRGTVISHFLVQSRWQAVAIGSEERVAVFILLVEETQLPIKSPVNPSSYIHAAWGMCRVLDETTAENAPSNSG